MTPNPPDPSGSTPVHQAGRSAYYPALDGLRTLAVAAVFLFHFIPRVSPWGWLGVQLFFVLSGFLITGILFDTRDAPHRFRNFYARRTLRIFPLYYGGLLVWTGVTLATHGTFPQHFWLWGVYLQNFFYITAHTSDTRAFLYTGSGHIVTAVGHLWTLAIEEQFYILWPLVVFTVKDRRRLIQICFAGILLRIALAAWWQTHLSAALLSASLTYRMLPTQCDGFLMGAILALWLRGRPSLAIPGYAGPLAAVGSATYAAILLLLHHDPGLIHGQDALSYNSDFQAILGIPFANLASVLLLFAALSPATRTFRLFHMAPLRSLGRVSYGLYFFHLPVYEASTAAVHTLYLRFGSHGRENLWHALIASLLTVALSYASFFLYESRFLRLKRAFSNPPSKHRKAPETGGSPSSITQP